ncbi:MAG: prepilin-type N-terminal cleavage/methylation domain-containing protein [Rhodobacter sp.]|uniref:PulJ/GspJ family protein n=1 Tax=Pararhodobacter sp. TaxID=2127056 RepID=UPI001D3A24D8|nr:prepilin-type N-terminal cleavage/methylation domain-containing protein [Pararhodobacter sp.]MCB1345633.1 prepilin-type N-terminal cleavage/methylation domain-containing protein [Paracoccaceae bacterium]MCC0072850.1 prepilin-type N-terminal cleavage/methylation domain-containing protein [Rhodobacter sp.]HPD92502.1 prepilin-type N-terminal cleavage/methylation domain-containing protein [Pararhodobacter sp.]
MRKGFTLIELLAAMAILAVVSVMAVQALGGVFHQRAVLTRHDDRDRAVIRTLSLLRLDLARAVPMDPGARTPTGGLLIDATGVTVRIGGVVAVAGGAPARAGSGLATVTWQVRDGTLFRALDGAAQPVLTGVRALSVTPLQPDDDPWSLAAGFEALVQTDDPGPLRLVVAR